MPRLLAALPTYAKRRPTAHTASANHRQRPVNNHTCSESMLARGNRPERFRGACVHYIPYLPELIVEVLAPVPSSLPPPPPRLTMATKCFGRRGLRVEPSPMVHGHLTPVDVEDIIRSFAKSPGPVGFRERPPLRSGSMKSIGFKPRWLRYAAVVQAQDVRLTCCWVILGTSPATILETQSAISTIYGPSISETLQECGPAAYLSCEPGTSFLLHVEMFYESKYDTSANYDTLSGGIRTHQGSHGPSLLLNDLKNSAYACSISNESWEML